jgi:D-alanine-D-alanine ligase
MSLRIAVLHHAVTADASADDRDVLDQARAVGEGLTALGHSWAPIECTLDLAAAKRRLLEFRPDLAFNLVESLAGTGRLIHLVPFLLDALSIPYTGSCAEAILATSHKLLAKDRLRCAGLPTPDWFGPFPRDIPALSPAAAGASGAGFRWIVKSVWEHASIGLDEEALAILDGPGLAAEALAAHAPRAGGACFAERFIEGREFNISLLAAPGGVQVLRPAEILFDGYPPGAAKIVGYRAKWDPGSFEYQHTLRRFDFPAEDAALVESLSELARKCWEAFGLRGYARVDYRVDETGVPWILEINANPCLSPDAGFAAALDASGVRLTAALGRILADSKTEGFSGGPAAFRPTGPPSATCPEGLRLRAAVTESDRRAVRDLAASTGFFGPLEVDVAEELVSERLQKGAASGYEFLFAESGGALAGYSCYGPVPMTAASFDLYWIVVSPALQRKGIGRFLVEETERRIRRLGGARLYAETSGRPQYAETRAFYLRAGFTPESRLKDFYAPGDDKVTYSKKL